ncbi:hypothetical protein PYW08_000344 [Mythimna loreyi]|uniref:Uncharacterized protein n=1 Tax=Mythimna loreyi TaxID=667449 RepID=A0ACC2RC78_9NEOP|nr:hypothetical protein PYW08_000344 [Mythimna loreyi]
MKLILQSIYKSHMLCYILLCFIFTVIKCFNPELTNEARNYTKEMVRSLFQPNALWKPGDIPLLNRKIFRGTRVGIREHPYVASVRRRIMHYTVATMLTKNLFVSVAHPLIDVPLNELAIVVGENYADRGATLLTIVVIVIHEHFDRYTLDADIALLRVYEDSAYRCPVKAIQLVHPNKSLDGHRAFVTGWGRCDRTGRELCLPRSGKYMPGEKFDPMLRSVSFVITQNYLYCAGYTQNGVTLKKGMLCAGRAREEDKVTSCLAVPGAPLVVDGNLAGMQSWGYGCGYEHDLPLIYTSMQHYQPWLLHNVPLMRRITKQNLTLLFEAKRAFILATWLNKNRVVPPEPYVHLDRPLVMLKIDRDLAKLKGNIYDMRDYLFDGIHHEYKTKLYARLRQRELDRNKLDKVMNTIPQPQLEPFLHANDTDIEGRDKNGMNLSHSDTDKSYEEYF